MKHNLFVLFIISDEFNFSISDPAAGASDDYSKSIGVKWVYTVELRPGDGDNDNDGGYGFDLPPRYIIPTAEEAFPGFMVVANRIMTGPN